MIGMSMPSFWLGILLIMLFSQQLKWLPAGDAVNGFPSYILPSICTGLMLMATSTRLTRSSMLEVLNSDFLRTARAKGVPEKNVIRTHALGNAWIPIITNMGMALSIMLAGSAVIEVAFTWPGVGRMLVNAVLARDVTTATGVVILTSVLYVFINLIVDVIYAFVDPRIKSQYVGANTKRKRHARQAIDRQEPENEPAVFIDSEELAAPAPLETHEDTAEPPATEEIAQAALPYAPLNEDADIYTLVSRKYRKRSRMGEVFHRLGTNKGAIAGLVIIIGLIVAVIASLFINFDSVTASNMQLRFAPPGPEAYFGTDNMGRDQFIRVIYGTRYSLFIGFGGVLVASIFGLILGVFAGYYGKLADELIMRFSDILASVPGMLLGMVIMIVMGNGTGNLVIAVGVPAIPIFIRITRASILSIRDNEYVEASRAIGFSSLRIVFTNILPNGLAPIIVTVTNYIGVMIIVGSSLSFLGFGVPLPHPEWGTMIANSRVFIHSAPWLTLFPGLFIMITVLAFNLLGDGLRDALDPKQKK
jgi:peptide/nickel transport system permease protein